MKIKDPITCRECGKKQSTKRARANNACCISCHQKICVHCGCTEATACYVSQRQLLSPEPDYCYFIAPGVCSNPACIKRAYHAITPEEVHRAQDYYDELATQISPRAPTLDDLRRGTISSESELAHVIINELLREDYGYLLASQGVDIFDLIDGNYNADVALLIAEMFEEWNRLVGRPVFAAGENLLTATAETVYG